MNSNLLKNIFTADFVQNNRYLMELGNGNVDAAYQSLVDNVVHLLSQSDITQAVSDVLRLSRNELESEDENINALYEEIGLKSKKLKNILRLVLKINDVIGKMNMMLSFKAVLSQALFNFNETNRSDISNNNYQAFTVGERVICLMHILFDIILNHDSHEIDTFVVMISKMCGKNSIWKVFHSLYHKVPLDLKFRDCVTDAYIFVKLLINLAHEERISDDHISMSVFDERCDEYSCGMNKWYNQGIWMTIVQTGIYMKNLKIVRETTVFNEFISERGGNVLTLLGGMYINKKSFNILYSIGMIYSLMFDETLLTVVENDMIYGIETENGIEYFASINDLIFDGCGNVVCVGFNNLASSDHEDARVIYQVIERQTDGYVYHDVYATKDMNVSRIVYMDDIENCHVRYPEVCGPLIYTPPSENAKEVDMMTRPILTGGRIVGGVPTNLFNEIQMSYLSEWISGIACLLIVIFIVAAIVRMYRKNKPLNIDKNVDGKLDSRVFGTMNENIPNLLI